ncbi:transcription factor 24 [Heterodontus francisci]|uniref:transcription factor 24 n=1 Tax=Heterodontus francisci TaxID=7792 RepID=UPI00355C54F0
MVQPKKSPMDSAAVPKAMIEDSSGSGTDLDSSICPTRKHSELASRSKVVRTRGRPAAANAARERSRVQTLRHAFLELQKTLPSVPPDTKLSKLDVLILATTYIAHMTRTLEESLEEGEGRRSAEFMHSLKVDGYLHPVKKWPMRSRLYVGATGQFLNSGQSENHSQGETTSPDPV